MAILECKKCKRQISSKTKICPGCGVRDPVNYEATQKAGGCLIVIILLFLGVWYMSSSDNTNQVTNDRDYLAWDKKITAEVVDYALPLFLQQFKSYEDVVTNERFPSNLSASNLALATSADQLVYETLDKHVSQVCSGKDFSQGEELLSATADYVCANIAGDFNHVFHALNLKLQMIENDGVFNDQVETELMGYFNDIKYVMERYHGLKTY